MLKNPKEMNRIVPTKIIAENAPGSWKVANKAEKEDYCTFFVDNSLGKGKAKLVSANDLMKKINYPENIKELLDKVSKRLYSERKISLDQYQRYIE